MAVALHDIDFARIRPYGQPASRSGAFEELSSILIEEGVVEWPAGVRFYRFGNPDGGREGKGILPNGDVWAWQSKYLFEFDSSAASQVTSSVKRVFEREPNLKRYFVTLPYDLPAGDTKSTVSAYTRWIEKVAEWTTLARDKGLEVDFVFVGAHQLLTALTEPQHAGRARYWFNADVLTPEAQRRRLEEIVAKAGRRYTPQLHVEVNAVRALDAVGRVAAYAEQWQLVLAELRKPRHWPWRAPSNVADAFKDALPDCAAALDEADAAIESTIAAAQSTDELPQIEEDLSTAVEAVIHVEDLLHTHSLTKDGHFVNESASLYAKVRDVLGALYEGQELADAETTRAAREQVLLLTGRAGTGKTHLFCDVANRRIAEGRPTVVLLGQDFDGRSLMSQVGELTQLGGSLDDVLAVLDAAAEAAGCTGILMIDALNESESPDRWTADVQALITAVARYPHTALAVSCRTEFVEAVVGDWENAVVEHVGFAEATDVAVRRFTQEYGLEPPTFPVLNPEFSNPLYLKLTCEALETLGMQRFPFGSAGLTTVCDAFLEAVNKRLSQPGRCDYDKRTDLVSRVASELALLGRGPFDRTQVSRITDAALPNRGWSRSLMRGLIAEGVLIEVSDGRIAFGYQRLGDLTRAAAIAGNSTEAVLAWLHELGDTVWPEQGVLGALAVIIPERYGVELVDLAVNDEGKVLYDFIDGFLESLMLRSPASVSPRTVEIVQQLIGCDYRIGEIWDRLVRMACVPDHLLNSRWLHTHLASYNMADRDKLWSTWLIGTVGTDDETPVHRLIEWAWPATLHERSAVPDHIGELATLVFGWFLTSSDRRVRDHATKAIVSIAERTPAGFAAALGRFRGTNDPYVIERLAAAACGVVLRSDDSERAHLIADTILEVVADSWPEHLMTRDFIRRILGRARALGWSGPDKQPPYDAQWPIETRTFEEIEALAGPPDYAYGSIWSSLTGLLGDFGRYVLRSAVDDFDSEDTTALQHHAKRAVFDRVLQLGWTPEAFGDTDRKRRTGKRGEVVERVGKKYQWIGLYEVLGRIADHYAIKRPWEDEPQRYQYAEQIAQRDIDPTVLTRRPHKSSGAEQPWFSPVSASFQLDIADDYPADLTGVPDPLDLIAVADAGGAQWLVLASSPSWEQPLPPEIHALGVPQLDVRMHVHAYLVPIDEAETLSQWAHGKDWSESWMPNIAEPHNLLLGSHPDDPEWRGADGRVDWRPVSEEGIPPADLTQCAAWYAGTGTSRDASAAEETRGYVPSGHLFDVLRLSRGVDFAWSDDLGVAVQDPSVVVGGPETLAMRRDMVPRLLDAGFTIFWTVVTTSELHKGDHMPPGDDYRWIRASTSYILKGNRVAKIGTIAARYLPGPEVEHDLDWVTKASDS